MTAVSDLLLDALVEIGVKSPDEALEANESSHALRVLNRMIAQWNAEQLMVYTIDRNLYSLVAGTQSYTLGPGGTLATTRPVRIEMASVQDSSLAKPLEIPIEILTDEKWRGIAVKNTTSVFPTCLWSNGNSPVATVYFWPIPTAATYQVILYTWGQTTSFASITSTVTFPPGYEEAIVTNLAVRLASSYGKSPDQVLIARAQTSKKLLETINLDPLYTGVEDALLRHSNTIGVRSFGMVVDR